MGSTSVWNLPVLTKSLGKRPVRDLDFFYEPDEPDQDDCTQDCHQNAPDQPATADAEQPDHPAANDGAEYPQHNIGKHAVSTAFHDLPGCPAGNQTYDDPPDKPMYHVILLEFLNGNHESSPKSNLMRTSNHGHCQPSW